MLYCESNLEKNKFVNLLKEELNQVKVSLEPRFELVVTIKGTQEFHHFRPLSLTKLGVKRISHDDQYALKVDVTSSQNQKIFLQVPIINKFVCAAYDFDWYIGLVAEVDMPNNDAMVKFMHPKGLSDYFHCPQKKHSCWIPFQHILCTMDVPCMMNNRGQYQLKRQSKMRIDQVWKKFIQK